MKKILFAAMALTTAIGLHSCLSTGDDSVHSTYFYPTTTMGKEMFADQVMDTTLVVSYDSWSAKIVEGIGGNWLTVTPTEAEVKAGWILSQSMKLKFSANTTGVTRSAVIMVTPHTDVIGSITLPVFQYGWLNITTPLAKYTSNDLNEARAEFAATYDAAAKQVLLACCVYSHATLTSDAAWLPVPKDYWELEPGTHGMVMPIDPNNTAEDRVAHLTLTSNGVSNIITYTQKGKK